MDNVRRIEKSKFENAVIFIFLLLFPMALNAQENQLKRYNPVWTSQSKNSGESMPSGGGDIGLNVWVEKGDILFYIARSGTFDENNALLKLGRVRIKLSPNPFDEGGKFRQELKLKEGYVTLYGSKNGLSSEVKIWTEVFNPAVHVEISSNKPIKAETTYENWRFADRIPKGKENNSNSWKWAPQGDVRTHKDEISFHGNRILFYHRNKDYTVFDAVVKQQGLDSVKQQLFNPLKNLTFGGMMQGSNMKPAGTTSGRYLDTDYKGWKMESISPARSHQVDIFLHTNRTESAAQWLSELELFSAKIQRNRKQAFKKNLDWWASYWNKSHIFIQPGSGEDDPHWQTGRNYQLFRYMLGCNAFGEYPTKFNGGLFTYDPVLTDSTLTFTPDFRNWGGGTHTAQNQRLVYWPMLKSGDWELMKPQFDFYLRILNNAELRSKVYWGHEGASFTEQMENFGLPNPAEYGWKRPDFFDKGVEYNAWLEYEWDTVLEFCMMMMDVERYAGKDISEYIPFIESCLRFFNEHYQYQARHRGRQTFDANGHLILYPGSAAETYKMAYNASSTAAGLKTVLERFLELPPKYLPEEKRGEWATMLKRIPPISFREFDGHTTIAPAKLWERINNTEVPQLYPVYPWGIYGIGRPGLDTAINTYKYDTDALKFRSHVGWKQDNIFAARLGLTDEALKFTTLKLENSGRRFPAFWGPGFDWTPDHNWGGSGMIGLQEMLLQTDGRRIYLFPAWPKDLDVSFKLHAPYQTTIEAEVKNGRVISLKVFPKSREKDVVNLY